MTSHRQQVCALLLPRRCTGMRSQDKDRHPTLRPSKPLQYAQSVRQFAHRQPHASGAHPCTPPCVRRCRPTTQRDSRTGFNLPSVLQRSMHTVRQQPLAYGITIGNGRAHHCRPYRRSSLRKCRANLPHILVAVGNDSRVHLMRILAQHRACGGTRPPRSLDLEQVSPYHPCCKSPCTRLANNQRLTTSNCQQLCTPFLPSRCTGMRHQHNSRHPTLRPANPRPYAQPARLRVPNSCVRSVAQLP